MTKPRILFIDDQLATNAAFRSDWLNRCNCVEIELDTDDEELDQRATDKLAGVYFCSGQLMDGEYRVNSPQPILDAVRSGWPSRAGWRWSMILMDLMFSSHPQPLRADITCGFRNVELLTRKWPDPNRGQGNCDIPVIMVTDAEWEYRATQANKCGATDYVEKSTLDSAQLHRLLLEHGLIQDGAIHRAGNDADYKPLLGRSLALLKVLRDARNIARMGTGNFLILGPQGSGKTHLGRYIFAHSEGKERFVVFYPNPAHANIETSNLLGSWVGAFTDAGNTAGVAEKAHKGILMIDEVHGLAPRTQHGLLDYLRLITKDGRRLRSVRRVGNCPRGGRERIDALESVVPDPEYFDPETDQIAVDVLVLAASNFPLDDDQWRKKKDFREAFWTRLALENAAAVVHFPSLAERREDILPIFRQFLDEQTTEIGGRQPKVIDEPRVRDLIQNASWPGNIAELRGFAGRIAVATKGFGEVLERHITRDDLRRLTSRWAGPQTFRGASLSSLPGILDQFPVRIDDQGLKGLKSHLDTAIFGLMKRAAGAAFFIKRKEVAKGKEAAAAYRLLEGRDERLDTDPSSATRLFGPYVGATASAKSLSTQEREELINAWKRGPGGPDHHESDANSAMSPITASESLALGD